MQVKKQQLERDMEQLTGSKLGKESIESLIGTWVITQGILSPCLFNLYAGYIMQNSGLVEAQAGIKIAGRNINNLRYAGDTILIAETKRN